MVFNTAPASAQVKFIFWIRPASLNALLGSANRIESCENAVIKTLAILQRFPTNFLYGGTNRLHVAV
jgi:hypothetical protein